MKKLFWKIFVFVTGMIIVFYSCIRDEDTLPQVDFAVSVSGEAPNAEIIIENDSKNLSYFYWTFGEGASIDTSYDANPTGIIVDKAGEIEVILFVSEGGSLEKFDSTLPVPGNSAIVEYADVEFGYESTPQVIGRCFSTATGTMYEDDNLNNEIGPTIDLVFESLGTSVNYFQNPTNSLIDIPNPTNTKVINYVAGELSISTFDAMADESVLKDLSITADGESFPGSLIPCIVLFENSSGKKGAIKVKTSDSDKIIVDIKVQKY